MQRLAFTDIGMGLDDGKAYLFGFSKQDIIMLGIVVSATIEFGGLIKKEVWMKLNIL